MSEGICTLINPMVEDSDGSQDELQLNVYGEPEKEEVMSLDEEEIEGCMDIITQLSPVIDSDSEDYKFEKYNKNQKNIFIEPGAIKNAEPKLLKKLYEAVYENNVKLTKKIIKEHPNIDIDVLYKECYNPLMIASANGCIEIVNLLLDLNADANVKNKDGETALILACEEIWALDNLPENATREVHYRDGIRYFKRHHEDIIKLLLEAGCDVDATTEPIGVCKERKSALQLLIFGASERVYKKKKINANFDARIRSIKYFMYHDVSLNTAIENNSRTILHLLCRNHGWKLYPEIFQFIFEELRKAEILTECINQEDQWHETPFQQLFYSSEHEPHGEIIDLFLRAPEFDNFAEQTRNIFCRAVDHACSISLLQQLLDYKMDMQNYEKITDSPFCKAIWNKNVSILKFLIENHNQIKLENNGVEYTLALARGKYDIFNMMAQIPEVDQQIIHLEKLRFNQVYDTLGLSNKRLLFRFVINAFIFDDDYEELLLQLFMTMLSIDQEYNFYEQDIEGNTDLHYLMTKKVRYQNEVQKLIQILSVLTKLENGSQALLLKNRKDQTPFDIFHSTSYAPGQTRFLENCFSSEYQEICELLNPVSKSNNYVLIFSITVVIIAYFYYLSSV